MWKFSNIIKIESRIFIPQLWEISFHDQLFNLYITHFPPHSVILKHIPNSMSFYPQILLYICLKSTRTLILKNTAPVPCYHPETNCHSLISFNIQSLFNFPVCLIVFNALFQSGSKWGLSIACVMPVKFLLIYGFLFHLLFFCLHSVC